MWFTAAFDHAINDIYIFRWKDECPGMKIVSSVAVRSKVYSLQMIPEEEYDKILASAEGDFEINPHIKRSLKRYNIWGGQGKR